ncbi:MAG: type II 3-dehydroquinate dehydratase [Gammaproteobacteria bacterium]|nr:type II 3-dehydroquinate dehydratase [Gammaproteobacteria bacterium]MYD79791.1 type II 3-dehydroquinate dehydratase [Gammaproteobacteria bacterium]
MNTEDSENLAAKSLLLINGPNLNMVGLREPDIYGSKTLDGIVDELKEHAAIRGFNLVATQSNSEGALVDAIQKSRDSVSFILLNAGAYSHSSIAIRDALLAVAIPFIELHISNVYSRESFRHRSLIADLAQGVIVGFGAHSYSLALEAAIHYLEDIRSD